ncbi:MAG: hypothetical protein H0Z33_13970 [Bacillaceae bacterium]|nr:hypothetical protein [Bacillaceae bacterium]
MPSKVTVDPKMQYFLAEDLVFRKLEQEFKIPIQRHMAFKSSDKLIEIDGISKTDNSTYGFEIKYNKRGKLTRNVIESLYQTAKNLDSASINNFKLIFAIVYEDKPVVNKSDLMSKLKNLSIPIEIKEYDFNKLKREFGLEK